MSATHEVPAAVEAERGVRLGPLVGVLAAVAVVSRLPGLVGSLAFNADEATLATGGRSMAHGGRLYVDVIDRKPPLPFALYAVVQRLTGTADLQWVRLVVLALVVATGVVVALEAGRRWGRSAAWVAGVVLVAGSTTLGPNDGPPANFEVIALLGIAVAVVAAARVADGVPWPRPWWAGSATAGLALAVAVLCKQPAAVTVIPVTWSLWRGGRVRAVAVAGVAGAMGFVVLAAPFGLAKVLDWAVLGTGGYLGMDPADIGVAVLRVLYLALLCVGFWAGAWLLAVAPAAAVDGGLARSPRDDVDLWLLLGASALGVIAGFRFFPHYLIQLLPAVALLAGRGAARRPTWVRPALALGVVGALAASALAWHTLAQGPPRYETDLAAYVHRHLDGPETTRDPILVWGNVPELYWRTDRRPAGGFTHSEFLTGYSGGRRHRTADESTLPDRALYDDWLQRLREDPPALILDTAAAGIRGGHDFPMAGFTAFAAFVHRHYERVATVDGVRVYALADSGGLGPEGGP